MSLKILFLTHSFYPEVGGTEANAEFLAQAFYEYGAKVHLLTWTKKTGNKNFPFTVLRNPNLLLLLKEHIWADVIFENNPCLRLSYPWLFFRKPLVVAINTWFTNTQGRHNIQSQLKSKWLKQASKVISVSNAIRERCWKNSIVIENAYNSNLFKVLPEVSRTKTFVFLGRLVSDKGANLAIEAINKLQLSNSEKRSSDSLSLTIIGDGEESETLKKMVMDLRLEEFVTFAGVLTGDELVKCLNKHKYLLVPSIWEEPFGIVALEGMACGCIPIVSDGGGLPDAVGEAGLIFKRGDVESLVNCIKNILNDTHLEKKLRSSALKHLAEHGPSYISKKYFEVIKSSTKIL